MSRALEMNATHKAVMMEVIDMYKTMSYLWDQSHPSYQDRPLRMKAYKKLLEKYQEIDQDATIAVVKAKLDNMRTGYARELKKVKESYNNSSNRERGYRPCLWYFELLNFLEETILKNTGKKHKRSAERAACLLYDYDGEASQQSGEYSQRSEYSPQAEYLEDEGAHSDHSSLEVPLKRPKYEESEESPRGREDDWQVIGRAIGLQLRHAAPRQAAIAQKLISDAIFYARLGRLTEDSAIVIN